MPTITLSDHFGYRTLLRFTLPTIAMMIFTSIYSVVDGIWFAILCAEVLTLALSVAMLKKLRGRYRYA